MQYGLCIALDVQQAVLWLWGASPPPSQALAAQRASYLEQRLSVCLGGHVQPALLPAAWHTHAPQVQAAGAFTSSQAACQHTRPGL